MAIARIVVERARITFIVCTSSEKADTQSSSSKLPYGLNLDKRFGTSRWEDGVGWPRWLGSGCQALHLGLGGGAGFGVYFGFDLGAELADFADDVSVDG